MDTSGNFSQALATFAEEATELIAHMEEILLRAESGSTVEEDMHALFRCAHTIKGSGGLFGLDEVVRFTHVVENVLDRLRKGDIQFGSELITVLLESQDQISALVNASLGEGIAADALLRSNTLIDKLKPWMLVDGGIRADTTVPPPAGLPAAAGTPVGSPYWHLSLRFARPVFTDGMDPLAFIHFLSSLGRIVHVETLLDTLPTLQDADPEMCYLGFELALDSSASQQDIDNVFEFVLDRSGIRVFPPGTPAETFLRLIDHAAASEPHLPELLLACGALTAQQWQQAQAAQAEPAPGPSAAPEPASVEPGPPAHAPADAPAGADPASSKPRAHEEKKAGEVKSIKVPSDRLDALINRVGELVIAGAGTYAKTARTNCPDLHESASQLLSLVEDIRNMTLALRMVPIGEVFSRFPRVVRDVARELDKEIELVITGADAELDKSMVEKLGDPLMHLVRNAMDHGIEPVAERLAAGKPACGTVGLHAYHESGTIIVEVTDDGKGLDATRILAKAIEKGLVSEGASLSEQEIFRLVLEPGFSTADTVTRLSGRGVGMDVARTNVEAMRGTLDIRSRAGQGTTMRLCLPLTLAIIDGFHIGVGNAHFIVPLDMVVECVELPPEIGNVDYMALREVAVPFVRLGQMFGEGASTQARPRVVVVYFSGRRVGLVVDRIFGKCQTVIKPLGPLFEHVPCVSGSTILGGGEVAMILDIAELIRDVARREAQQSRTAATAA